MHVSPPTAQFTLSLHLPPLGERQMLLTHEEPATEQSAAASLVSHASPGSEKYKHLEPMHDSVSTLRHWPFDSHRPPVAGRTLQTPPMQTSRRHCASVEQLWAFTVSDAKRMRPIVKTTSLTTGNTLDVLVLGIVLTFIVLGVRPSLFVVFASGSCFLFLWLLLQAFACFCFVGRGGGCLCFCEERGLKRQRLRRCCGSFETHLSQAIGRDN